MVLRLILSHANTQNKVGPLFSYLFVDMSISITKMFQGRVFKHV